MLTVNALREFGANTEEGLGRCMNNEQFYLRLVKLALEDASFSKLSDAIENGDTHTAFEAAHALKGVLGNLSLTPLFDLASEMTELLRHDQQVDYKPYLDELLSKREELRTLNRD